MWVGAATQHTFDLEMSRTEFKADVGRSLAQALLKVIRSDLPVVQPDGKWQQ